MIFVRICYLRISRHTGSNDFYPFGTSVHDLFLNRYLKPTRVSEIITLFFYRAMIIIQGVNMNPVFLCIF